MIPQGGGDFDTGYRCAGEWMTKGLMRATYRGLTDTMHYKVPQQDVQIDLSRLPTMPNSGMVLADIRAV